MVKNLTLKTQYHSLKYQNWGGHGLMIFYIYMCVYIAAVIQRNSIPGVHCVFIYVIINMSINKCA